MCNKTALFTAHTLQRPQLELDALQQKCDAWREEAERLGPLREEVATLTAENSRLQQEVGQVAQDNAGLARQLQDRDEASTH